MTILAFLQNQWFRNPETIAAGYRRLGDNLEKRARLNEMLLFYKSHSGKRLMKVFGKQSCEQIIWENASTNLGGKASDVFPADPVHMQRVLYFWDPDVVILFGRVAQEGMTHVSFGNRNQLVIKGPHPAARQADTMQRLCELRDAMHRPLVPKEKTDEDLEIPNRGLRRPTD